MINKNFHDVIGIDKLRKTASLNILAGRYFSYQLNGTLLSEVLKLFMLYLPAIRHRDSIHKKVSDIVFACAWCPPETYVKLHNDQEYSHGMCQKHKRLFIAKVKHRIMKMKKSIDAGSMISVMPNI